MSKRLLILVDNEPVTTRALALDLTDAGYHVRTAADREEARRVSRSSPFDLLIAGEQSAPGPGRGFVEEFRRVHPAAKVVLMTTGGAGSSGAEAPEARVRKPFDLEVMRTLVGRLLEEEGSGPGRAR